MKKQTIALCAGMSLMALALTPSAIAAPHTVTSGYTAADLVDFLIPVSSSITIVPGSETYSTTVAGATPDLSAIGEFAGGSALNNLPFASGVILTTGRLDGGVGAPPFDTGSTGPNDYFRTSHTWGSPGSATLQSALLTGTTSDAASLKFRFTSTATAFSFQYMFASDEYEENVGSAGNDAFAFLLTDTQGTVGTGDDTTVNLAVIGGLPVSVNNVNSTTNPGYFTSNPDTLDPYDIEFDGMAGGQAALFKLFASSSIVPGREYIIEMVIADVGDPSNDSAVFIGADSFVDVPQQPVPEPSTYVGAIALAGLVASKLRRRKA